MTTWRMRGLTAGRLAPKLLIVAAALATAAYLLMFFESDIFDPPRERILGEGITAPVARVYVEPTSLDVVRDVLQLRIFLEPAGDTAEHALRFGQDLTLSLLHDGVAQEVLLRAGQLATSVMVELDLSDGDISRYPLDVYHAALSIDCVDPRAGPLPQPVTVTVWERLLGFRLQAREPPGGTGQPTKVLFTAGRSFAFKYFATATYGAMAVLACGALTIGTMVFLGIRRPEATLLGALGAIVFALPALRNALPGGAPLGVLADVFVFFWAELAAVCALAMAVGTWAVKGPRP